MASTSASNGDAPTSQPVVFTTQTQYPLPTQKYMIPTTWKRYQLSQLINKALSLEKHVPFDFIVRGEVLRTTLSEWCAEHGVAEEETLEIEYIESVTPPQRMSDIFHEDWVSAVSCQLPGYFLTSSYDGSLRVFNYSKSLVSTHAAHNVPITSFTILPSTSSEILTVATASHDLTVQLTELTLPETPGAQASAKPLSSLHLHTAPVSSVAASPAGTHLLTSSWDSLIGLWDTTIPEDDEVPSVLTDGEGRKKRRKVQEDGRGTRKAPINVLKGHTARVSAVTFGGEGDVEQKAVSCGFDSTVRLWDLELGICERTISASEKPFLSLTTLNPTTALVTSTDRTLSLIDLRTPSSINSISSITASFSHPATPSCISAAPTNANQAVTGSYDGVVRVWDMRSTKGSVASFLAFGKDGQQREKILSVDWKRGMVGVGGEGGIEVWKVGEDKP
ncbi:ribosome biogenesis protein YTM1 [Cyathus striatus]|nr:ribosome biogenesis protein YTM1 [Cyathus striatus]